jgi:pantoate--beta-alanine ligase
MKVFVTNLELNLYLNSLKQNAKKALSIGFVPTMGALHAGHISLIKQAKKLTDVVVCSIFVNPTQFNDPKDLEKYPRTPEKDTEMLEMGGCDVLFMPSVEEIYPNKDPFHIDLGYVDKILEGEFRPGHFKGVAQVVYRLFEIVKPDKALFGLKDFQQVMVVKQVAKQMLFPLEIVPCDIIREPSGLAMSSRNRRLSDAEIMIANHISRILFWAKKHQASYTSLKQLKEVCIQQFALVEGLKLDYLEFVDKETLLSDEVSMAKHGVIVLCAAFVGPVRLIDNLILS